MTVAQRILKMRLLDQPAHIRANYVKLKTKVYPELIVSEHMFIDGSVLTRRIYLYE